MSSALLANTIPTTGGPATQQSPRKTVKPSPPAVSSTDSETAHKAELTALLNAAQRLEKASKLRSPKAPSRPLQRTVSQGVPLQAQRPKDAPPSFICQACQFKGGFHKSGCKYRKDL